MAHDYRIVDHTADLGIEVYGRDERLLFNNAGRALFDLITDLSAVEEKDSLSLTVEGVDWEDLMVNWLSELLAFHQLDGYLLKGFAFHHVGECLLNAVVTGEKYNPDRHELLREIKAVTYHQIEVVEEKERWIARIVFDI